MLKNGWHSFFIMIANITMNNWLKTLIAGYAGWKWGGGCFGFIVVFAIVYFLLGHAHCWKYSPNSSWPGGDYRAAKRMMKIVKPETSIVRVNDKITIHQNFTFLSANCSVTFVGEKDRRYSHWILFTNRRNKCAGSQRLLEGLIQYAGLFSQ